MLAFRVDLSCFMLQVFKDQLDHLRIFDADNHFDVTAAVFAELDINIEHSFEALHLGHGLMPLCRAIMLVSIGRLQIRLLAAFVGCDLGAVLAVGREDTMEPCEVNS